MILFLGIAFCLFVTSYGDVLVCNSNGKIYHYSSAGALIGQFADITANGLSSIGKLVFRPANKDVFVTVSTGLARYSNDGTFLSLIPVSGITDGGLAYDASSNRIFVTTSGTIRVIDGTSFAISTYYTAAAGTVVTGLNIDAGLLFAYVDPTGPDFAIAIDLTTNLPVVRCSSLYYYCSFPNHWAGSVAFTADKVFQIGIANSNPRIAWSPKASSSFSATILASYPNFGNNLYDLRNWNSNIFVTVDEAGFHGVKTLADPAAATPVLVNFITSSGELTSLRGISYFEIFPALVLSE